MEIKISANKLILRPEEGLDLKSECILVRGTYPRNKTFVEQQVCDSGANEENTNSLLTCFRLLM